MIGIITRFFRLYPRDGLLLSVSLLLVNIAEAVGITLVIPVFDKLLNQDQGGGRFGAWIDRIFASAGLQPTLVNVLIGLTTAFSIKALLTIWARHIVVGTSSRFQFQMQKTVFDRLMQLQMGFFSQTHRGSVINSLTAEAGRAANAFVTTSMWVSAFISGVLYLTVAVLISGWLALMALVVGAIALSPLRLIVRKAVYYGNRTSQLNEEIQKNLLETFDAMKPIKAAALEQQAARQFGSKVDEYRRTWYRIAFNANSLQIYAQPIAVAVLSLIMLVAVDLRISVAELMVFLLAFMRLMPTLSQLQSLRNELNSNLPGFDRLDGLLRETETYRERTGGNAVSGVGQGIEFISAGFTYDGTMPVLKAISLRIEPDTTVAFIGGSGSGKTTIVDLIMGFYSPTTGNVRVNGYDLTEIDLGIWRKCISYVGQETILFDGTVRENIAWGVSEAGVDCIKQAARDANAHEFIMRLENGYDTAVGDRGVRLSGGQRQRIALARALLRRPQLLILDEATSALDFESETAIHEAIERLARSHSMTIIIIAHRLSSVRNADRIFVVDQGAIAEHGTWIELSENKQGYIGRYLDA